MNKDFDLMNNNKVTVVGNVTKMPIFSHEMYGENFYEFEVEVPRLSLSSDFIPVTISSRLLSIADINIGKKIALSGQFRSYNKLIDGKSRLMLTIFVREILHEEMEYTNNIEITGYVCKEPIFRVTPFKREITDILIAVNRSYNKSDYLPCIAWGRNARFIKDLRVGDKVNLSGRIQSRAYTKKTDDSVENKVAYEVSLSRIVHVACNEGMEEYCNNEKITKII